jgi:hypothetical protein
LPHGISNLVLVVITKTESHVGDVPGTSQRLVLS